MAKLKAPLMSLGASGALGKSLVFFPWKGLDVVREYVIPSNPKSTDQQTQRGYFIASVAAIHAAQALATDPLAAIDDVAYALLGSCQPTPRTWFNTIVKQWLDQKVATKYPSIWTGGVITEASGSVTVECHNQDSESSMTACAIRYGPSKTALINVHVCTMAEIYEGHAISGLTNGTKYYFQVHGTAPAGFEGSDSGIYHGTPHA